MLDNGLRVYLLEDHEVPLVKGTLLMKGGARASPPDKVSSPPHVHVSPQCRQLPLFRAPQ